MVSKTMAGRGDAVTERMMGLLCVAKSKLEGLTAGQSQITMTGDYSAVVIVEADGRINSWQRPSRIRPLPNEIRQPINVREYPVRLSG